MRRMSLVLGGALAVLLPAAPALAEEPLELGDLRRETPARLDQSGRYRS